MDPPGGDGVHLSLPLRPETAPHRGPGWLDSGRRPAAVLASGVPAGATARLAGRSGSFVPRLGHYRWGTIGYLVALYLLSLQMVNNGLLIALCPLAVMRCNCR